ncbi:alpha/beta hydrolase [Maribacter sp. CXY002]|uniref:alpha/beta hydrolase n=1 Tax=Maribacter luteocoastalis TaxID=3407671 RepID=UPI003B686161
MTSISKNVTYTHTNTYETLNELTPKTKNIWLVFHGIGYLSRYFLKYFDELPSEENYIIAPQAPSKYYLNNKYKHVGASWLTKENTKLETNNVITYVDTVLKAEGIGSEHNLIVFGYSQGVSIATRWIVNKNVNCYKLVLYAGGIPNELTSLDFQDLLKSNTEVITLVGDNDPYLTPERMKDEDKKIDDLFNRRAIKIVFEGGHEVKKELINALIKH